MRTRHALPPTILLLLTLAAERAPAQPAQAPAPPPRRSAWRVVRPLLEGAAGGTALAAGYIGSGDSGWLVSDATAFNAALATGITAALGADHDVSLALRAPVRGRLALEALALVRNANRERVARETRCGFFGCTEGTYVVDHRYEQSLAGLLRAAYRVPLSPRLTSVVTVGAGPMATHVDAEGVPATRRDDLLLDVGVGLERGRVSRWTVEANVRGPVPRATGARTGPELAVRVGRAFGYR